MKFKHLTVKNGSFAAVSVLIFFILLSAVVWGRTASYEFVWDDEFFIVSNPALRSWSFVPRYFTDVSTVAGKGYGSGGFRPLRNISYLVDFKIFGLKPAGWHIHNIIIHLINAMLVFFIARKILKTKLPALFAGALYLIHPVQTEVVAWVKCRDDLLAGLFTLGAFLLWLRWRTSLLRLRHLAFLVVLYFLACLSKAQAVVFPIVLIGYEYWKKNYTGGMEKKNSKILQTGDNSLSLSSLWIVFFCLSAVGMIYLTWRHFFIGRTMQCSYLAGSFLPTMLTMAKVGVKYLALLVYPHKLLADYSGMQPLLSMADWRVWFFWGTLFAVVILVYFARRKLPVILFGLIWIVAYLLPVSNIIPMMQYMAERFLYLPMAGVALAAASILKKVEGRSIILSILCACIILTASAVKSINRAKVWENNSTLYTATVRDAPADAIRARTNLLGSLINRGEYEKALFLHEQIGRKIRSRKTLLPRDKAEHVYYQGLIYWRMGRCEDAKNAIHSAIEIDSSYSDPYLHLGIIEGMAGNDVGALEWFEQALKKSPEDAIAYYNKGLALRNLGRAKEAENAFRQAMLYCYEGPEAHKTLAALLWKQERFKEVIPIYREALHIWGDNNKVKYWLDRATAIVK